MLEKGQIAPAVTLPNQYDVPVSLADFRGERNVVLYFYPKDDTPGCTVEANQFTALADEFENLDTVVIGISRDSCDSHRAFIDKYDLRVKLLSDEDGELCKSYGVWQEKERNGVRRMGIVRSTFIIDKQGVLVDAEYGVSPDGHARVVLDKLDALTAIA